MAVDIIVYPEYVNKDTPAEYLWSSDSLANDLIAVETLKVENNKAGTFRFTMFPTHPLYDRIHRMKTVIAISIDDDEVFRGRVIDTADDFYKQRVVICEGDLAYLLDSIIPAEKKNMTPAAYFEYVLQKHWDSIKPEGSSPSDETLFKRFKVGTVNVTDLPNTAKEFDNTSYRSASDVIDDLLIGYYGGFLVSEHRDDGITYLHWVSDMASIVGYKGNDQRENGEISFGLNLLSLDQEAPIDDVFSVLLPVGYNKLTLTTAQVATAPYIVSQEALATYGRIVRTQQFDDVTDRNKLYTEGLKYLRKYTTAYPNNLTVKAVDVYYIGESERRIRLGDKVKAESEPHGIEAISQPLTCLAIEYNFVSPSDDTYVLGTYIPPDPKRRTANIGRSGSSRARLGGGGKKVGGLSAPNFKEQMDNLVEELTDRFNLGDTIRKELKASPFIHANQPNVSLFTATNAENPDPGPHWKTNEDSLLGRAASWFSSPTKSIFGGDSTLSSWISQYFDLKNLSFERGVEYVEKIEGAITGVLENREAIDTVQEETEEVVTRLDVIDGRIEAEVTRATSAEGTLSSRITVTESGISAEVSRATTAEATLRASIQVNADKISTKVSAGDIASEINQTPQSVLIQASKINLEGYVTASSIEAEIGYVDKLSSQTVQAGSGVATSSLIASAMMFDGTTAAWREIDFVDLTANATRKTGYFIGVSGLTSLAINASDLDHYHSFTESDGKIYIGKATGTQGSFSIAATQTYIDGVAAAKESVSANVVFAGNWHTWDSTYHMYHIDSRADLSNDKSFDGGASFVPQEAIDYGRSLAPEATISGWTTYAGTSYSNKQFTVYAQANLSNGGSGRHAYYISDARARENTINTLSVDRVSASSVPSGATSYVITPGSRIRIRIYLDGSVQKSVYVTASSATLS